MKTPAAKPYDPNFEALLREAAADPHSTLLRVRRSQVFPALRSREPAASVAMAGLSTVERELLASYRCELGFLLRQAACMALMTDATTRTWIDATITSDRIHDVPNHQAWAHNAHVCIGWVPINAPRELLETLDFVQQLLTSGLGTVNVPELAVAALRVEAVDHPRVYSGAHFAALGACERSIVALRPVLDGLASHEHEVFAREAAALALGRSGKFEEAVEVLDDALGLRYERVEIPLRFLFYATLSGVLPSIERAASIVSEMVPQEHPGIDRFCGDVGSKVRAGYWQIPIAAKSYSRQIGGRGGSISKRVLDEIIL